MEGWRTSSTGLRIHLGSLMRVRSRGWSRAFVPVQVCSCLFVLLQVITVICSCKIHWLINKRKKEMEGTHRLPIRTCSSRFTLTCGRIFGLVLVGSRSCCRMSCVFALARTRSHWSPLALGRVVRVHDRVVLRACLCPSQVVCSWKTVVMKTKGQKKPKKKKKKKDRGGGAPRRPAPAHARSYSFPLMSHAPGLIRSGRGRSRSFVVVCVRARSCWNTVVSS
jgi:hypothetical protein